MEDKPVGGDSPATAEPASSSRRRAASQKRKANALSTSNTSSTPSKRFTREKAAISHSPIHNGGPLTRARQSPNNFGAPATLAAGGSGGNRGLKAEEKVGTAAAEAATIAALEEEACRIEELKAVIESEFEAIRSRDSNAHVVPSHCGWFSWTKVHPLEERVLQSFFNGKSQTRTPDTYMKIRNWIVKRFHFNPNVQIELKDLSELEVEDVAAKQEVLEFLDYWGLINFHPFPQTDSSANVNCDDDVASKKELLEKLFHFESIQPYTPVVPKPNVSTPAMPSGLFPESSVAEESARPEGPAVEYHCNSCSADCSRKRYHCQTQADYDLCADCFTNGKFGSDMASSDFILMEHAEAPGVSSGKWTDQETLLLLEALELFKENWNEIAEHVATKTKAQCILHFVQMPIEDIFFDCDDNVDETSKENTDRPATINDTSAPKDGTEINEDKNGTKEDQPLTSALKDANEVCQETAKLDNASEEITTEETSKSKDTSELKTTSHTVENFALKALAEAFESVGHSTTPETRLSFAEVGNPVMALAAFLGRLVGRDVAMASAQSSMKSLNSDCPGMQLAARHCFLLEDPQDDLSGVDCTATEITNQDASKVNQESQNQKGNNLSSDHPNNKKIEDSIPGERQPPDSSNEQSNEEVNTANDAGTEVPCEEGEPGKSKDSNDSELGKSSKKSQIKESNHKLSSSQPTKVCEDMYVAPDLKPSHNKEPAQFAELASVGKPISQAAVASKDVNTVLESLPPEKQQEMKSTSGDQSRPTEKPKDAEMLPDAPNSVENGVTAAENQKDNEKVKLGSKEIKDDHNIDKIKSAAVSALSAAAVKAKLLADQEEDQIRHLAASLIEKQLHKLEMKLAFFNDVDHVIMRVREHLDRSRQRLFHERAQIIAARLGIPPSSSRAIPPTLPANRIAMNFANSMSRPHMNLNSQQPPISRPIGSLAPTPSNPFVSTTTAGNSIQPSGQDKISPVATK